MSKRADQIVNDAINKANQTISRTSGGALRYGPDYSEYSSNPATQAAVSMARQEYERAIAVAIANALDIGRKALRAYVQEEAEPVHKEFKRLQEDFEVLFGTRSNTALGQRAVKFDNIRPLVNVPSQPAKSRKVVGAPTEADFNALFDDVRALYNILFEIGVQIRSHGTSKN